jgi:hypothetical protein
MHRTTRTAVALAALLIVPQLSAAQETSRAVENGGVHIEGWKGKIDAGEAQKGAKLEDSKLDKMGSGMHVTTGPAVVYWSDANKASGSYTVKATFTEQKYMNLNDHPHPYGVFIGGNDMGTDNETLLYCAAYGNGSFIVRGFGPAPFALNGRRAEANDAVHKAAGKGEPVTQEVAITVKPDVVECSINGTVVGSYPKSDVVGEGKLKSTDGVFGIRFAHNTEAHVANFGMTKN